MAHSLNKHYKNRSQNWAQVTWWMIIILTNFRIHHSMVITYHHNPRFNYDRKSRTTLVDLASVPLFSLALWFSLRSKILLPIRAVLHSDLKGEISFGSGVVYICSTCWWRLKEACFLLRRELLCTPTFQHSTISISHKSLRHFLFLIHFAGGSVFSSLHSFPKHYFISIKSAVHFSDSVYF